VARISSEHASNQPVVEVRLWVPDGLRKTGDFFRWLGHSLRVVAQPRRLSLRDLLDHHSI